MLNQLLPFDEDVGLLKSFQGIGLAAPDLDALVQLVLRDGSPVRNLPFDFGEADVRVALKHLVK